LPGKTVLPESTFRIIKREIRVLGIDDGAFVPRKKSQVHVVGVVFRGGYWLDGVLHTKIAVDGLDSTQKISSMIIRSPHYKQLRIIMLNGITFAGFNIVDIRGLYTAINLPILTVTRERPNFPQIQAALMNLPNYEERWRALSNAGELSEVCTRQKGEKIYFHSIGISKKDAERILRLTSTRSTVPEALRIAHLIASGLFSR